MFYSEFYNIRRRKELWRKTPSTNLLIDWLIKKKLSVIISKKSGDRVYMPRTNVPRVVIVDFPVAEACYYHGFLPICQWFSLRASQSHHRTTVLRNSHLRVPYVWRYIFCNSLKKVLLDWKKTMKICVRAYLTIGNHHYTLILFGFGFPSNEMNGWMTGRPSTFALIALIFCLPYHCTFNNKKANPKRIGI